MELHWGLGQQSPLISQMKKDITLSQTGSKWHVNIFIKVPWKRTGVLKYYKEHSEESTRCKTEHSDAKPKCKLQYTVFWNQWVYREVYLHHIIQNLVYLFRQRNISIYNLNYNSHYLIMIIFHIPKLFKKLISVSFGGLVLSAKSSSLKTVPVSRQALE